MCVDFRQKIVLEKSVFPINWSLRENKKSQNDLRVALSAPKIWPNLARFWLCISRTKSVGRRWCVIVRSPFRCGTGRTILARAVSASSSTNFLQQFCSLPLVLDASAARRLMPRPQSLPSSVTIAWDKRQIPTALVSPLAHDFNIAFTPWLRRRGLRDRATWPSSTPTLFLQPLTLAVAAGCCGGVHMA